MSEGVITTPLGDETQPVELSSGSLTVTTTSLGGETKTVEVPSGCSASELRECVALSWGVSPVEVKLIDNVTGTNIFFGDPGPLHPLPVDLLFVRINTWAGVPDGLHHKKLSISEDRMEIAHSDVFKNNESCFLSAALVKGVRYIMSVQIGGPELEGGFVGVVRDTMTEWDYLNGLWILIRDGRLYNDHFDGEREFKDSPSLNKEALSKAHADGLMQIIVDTELGSLELLNKEGDVILRKEQREIAVETSLRFAASFYTKGTSLKIIDSSVK